MRVENVASRGMAWPSSALAGSQTIREKPNKLMINFINFVSMMHLAKLLSQFIIMRGVLPKINGQTFFVSRAQ